MSDIVSSNPFALLTFIAAPALLTNACSVLALSTSNRFLRAGERLREVASGIEKCADADDRAWRLVQMGRIERQALLLLDALRFVYAALGSFVSASLIAIVGAAMSAKQVHPFDSALMVLGMGVGFVGAGAVVCGCVNLFRATRLSMLNISDEAQKIRHKLEHQSTEKP